MIKMVSSGFDAISFRIPGSNRSSRSARNLTDFLFTSTASSISFTNMMASYDACSTGTESAIVRELEL